MDHFLSFLLTQELISLQYLIAQKKEQNVKYQLTTRTKAQKVLPKANLCREETRVQFVKGRWLILIMYATVKIVWATLFLWPVALVNMHQMHKEVGFLFYFFGGNLYHCCKRGKKVHFGRTVHCLPLRLKSKFFEKISSVRSLKGTRSEEKISKNVDFSL